MKIKNIALFTQLLFIPSTIFAITSCETILDDLKPNNKPENNEPTKPINPIYKNFPSENSYMKVENTTLESGYATVDGSKLIITLIGTNLNPSIDFYNLKVEVTTETPIAKVPIKGALYKPENFSSTLVTFAFDFKNEWAKKKISIDKDGNSKLVFADSSLSTLEISVPNQTVQAYDSGDFSFTQDGTILKYNGSDENLIVPSILKLPNQNEITIRRIGTDAFKDNKTIKNLTLPSTLLSIGLDAFNGTEIENININDGLEYIEPGGIDIPKIKEIYLPKSLRYLDSKVNNDSALRKVYISKYTSYFFKGIEPNQGWPDEIKKSFNDNVEIIEYW